MGISANPGIITFLNEITLTRGNAEDKEPAKWADIAIFSAYGFLIEGRYQQSQFILYRRELMLIDQAPS